MAKESNKKDMRSVTIRIDREIYDKYKQALHSGFQDSNFFYPSTYEKNDR
ncbi:hypothetical protein QMO72_13965 (plasmid) [Staphylococcus casei]|nr:hypothetical protein [Staphylococcus casei]WJE87810.1 hypothetical protein QMO72_13965 [Staphylococcus casei]